MLGLEDLGQEPRYRVTLERLADADLLEKRIAPALLQRTAAEWFHEGQAARVPFALVPTVADLLGSPQFTNRGAFAEVSYDAGPSFVGPALPFRMSLTPANASGRSPQLGENAGDFERGTSERPNRSSSTAMPEPGTTALLQGIRVIDLSMGWAGPLAARHLADMGADVIKVESCRYFDWWRGWDLTPEAMKIHAWEKSAAFNMVNRNKRGITLDLSSERGSDLLKELVATADVVVENYAGSVLPKLGLDYEVLCKANPSIVMLSMPPFGSTGEWKSYRAYGSTVEQASGFPTSKAKRTTLQPCNTSHSATPSQASPAPPPCSRGSGIDNRPAKANSSTCRTWSLSCRSESMAFSSTRCTVANSNASEADTPPWHRGASIPVKGPTAG